MIGLLRGLGRGALGAVAVAASAAAQGPPEQPASNPICVRLEAQLASLDRGAADPARADQIKRYEDAVARQQADLDRLVEQSRRHGCEGIAGFFALFTGQSPQCTPLNSQIQQMRGALDRTMSDLERLKSGNNGPQGQRRALVGQLAQNNCGPQYRAAAAAAGPFGFLDSIFGGTVITPGGNGAPSGTYRTVCVRTCDGYYFPISYSTVPSRFPDDQRTCLRECPATEAVLYTYRNPGEDIGRAVSLNGSAYTALAHAFLYRRELSPGCSCRRPGQSWADALRNADDSSTLERGDIVVTEQKAKALSQPRVAPAKAPLNPPRSNAANGPGVDTPPPAADPSASPSDAAPRTVRTVGPPFLSPH